MTASWTVCACWVTSSRGLEPDIVCRSGRKSSFIFRLIYNQRLPSRDIAFFARPEKSSTSDLAFPFGEVYQLHAVDHPSKLHLPSFKAMRMIIELLCHGTKRPCLMLICAVGNGSLVGGISFSLMKSTGKIDTAHFGSSRRCSERQGWSYETDWLDIWNDSFEGSDERRGKVKRCHRQSYKWTLQAMLSVSF